MLHLSIFCRCILVVFHRNFAKILTFRCFLSKRCGPFPPGRKNVTHHQIHLFCSGCLDVFYETLVISFWQEWSFLESLQLSTKKKNHGNCWNISWNHFWFQTTAIKIFETTIDFITKIEYFSLNKLKSSSKHLMQQKLKGCFE